MYKNQKAEIATFISIATLIGIAVFTLITAKVNTNISQKQTTNTKAAVICDGTPVQQCNNGSYNPSRGACCTTSWQCIGSDWDPDLGPYCNEGSNYPSLNRAEAEQNSTCCGEIESCPSYPYYACAESGYTYAEGQGCCKYVEDPAPVDPGSSSGENTCVSGYCVDSASCSDRDMDNVSGESCGINNWSCCKERVAPVVPEDDCQGGYCIQGSCDGSEMDANNGTCGASGYSCCKQRVNLNYGCNDTSLTCDTSGNTCNGTIDGSCYQNGIGICCKANTNPYSSSSMGELRSYENLNQPCATGNCITEDGGCVGDYESNGNSCREDGRQGQCCIKKYAPTEDQTKNTCIERGYKCVDSSTVEGYGQVFGQNKNQIYQGKNFYGNNRYYIVEQYSCTGNDYCVIDKNLTTTIKDDTGSGSSNSQDYLGSDLFKTSESCGSFFTQKGQCVDGNICSESATPAYPDYGKGNCRENRVCCVDKEIKDEGLGGMLLNAPKRLLGMFEQNTQPESKDGIPGDECRCIPDDTSDEKGIYIQDGTNCSLKGKVCYPAENQCSSTCVKSEACFETYGQYPAYGTCSPGWSCCSTSENCECLNDGAGKYAFTGSACPSVFNGKACIPKVDAKKCSCEYSDDVGYSWSGSGCGNMTGRTCKPLDKTYTTPLTGEDGTRESSLNICNSPNSCISQMACQTQEYAPGSSSCNQKNSEICCVSGGSGIYARIIANTLEISEPCSGYSQSQKDNIQGWCFETTDVWFNTTVSSSCGDGIEQIGTCDMGKYRVKCCAATSLTPDGILAATLLSVPVGIAIPDPTYLIGGLGAAAKATSKAVKVEKLTRVVELISRADKMANLIPATKLGQVEERIQDLSKAAKLGEDLTGAGKVGGGLIVAEKAAGIVVGTEKEIKAGVAVVSEVGNIADAGKAAKSESVAAVASESNKGLIERAWDNVTGILGNNDGRMRVGLLGDSDSAKATELKDLSEAISQAKKEFGVAGNEETAAKLLENQAKLEVLKNADLATVQPWTEAQKTGNVTSEMKDAAARLKKIYADEIVTAKAEGKSSAEIAELVAKRDAIPDGRGFFERGWARITGNEAGEGFVAKSSELKSTITETKEAERVRLVEIGNVKTNIAETESKLSDVQRKIEINKKELEDLETVSGDTSAGESFEVLENNRRRALDLNNTEANRLNAEKIAIEEDLISKRKILEEKLVSTTGNSVGAVGGNGQVGKSNGVLKTEKISKEIEAQNAERLRKLEGRPDAPAGGNVILDASGKSPEVLLAEKTAAQAEIERLKLGGVEKPAGGNVILDASGKSSETLQAEKAAAQAEIERLRNLQNEPKGVLDLIGNLVGADSDSAKAVKTEIKGITESISQAKKELGVAGNEETAAKLLENQAKLEALKNADLAIIQPWTEAQKTGNVTSEMKDAAERLKKIYADEIVTAKAEGKSSAEIAELVAKRDAIPDGRGPIERIWDNMAGIIEKNESESGFVAKSSELKSTIAETQEANRLAKEKAILEAKAVEDARLANEAEKASLGKPAGGSVILDASGKSPEVLLAEKAAAQAEIERLRLGGVEKPAGGSVILDASGKSPEVLLAEKAAAQAEIEKLKKLQTESEKSKLTSEIADLENQKKSAQPIDAPATNQPVGAPVSQVGAPPVVEVPPVRVADTKLEATEKVRIAAMAKADETAKEAERLASEATKADAAAKKAVLDAADAKKLQEEAAKAKPIAEKAEKDAISNLEKLRKEEAKAKLVRDKAIEVEKAAVKVAAEVPSSQKAAAEVRVLQTKAATLLAEGKFKSAEGKVLSAQSIVKDATITRANAVLDLNNANKAVTNTNELVSTTKKTLRNTNSALLAAQNTAASAAKKVETAGLGFVDRIKYFWSKNFGDIAKENKAAEELAANTKKLEVTKKLETNTQKLKEVDTQIVAKKAEVAAVKKEIEEGLDTPATLGKKAQLDQELAALESQKGDVQKELAAISNADITAAKQFENTQKLKEVDTQIVAKKAEVAAVKKEIEEGLDTPATLGKKAQLDQELAALESRRSTIQAEGLANSQGKSSAVSKIEANIKTNKESVASKKSELGKIEEELKDMPTSVDLLSRKASLTSEIADLEKSGKILESDLLKASKNSVSSDTWYGKLWNNAKEIVIENPKNILAAGGTTLAGVIAGRWYSTPAVPPASVKNPSGAGASDPTGKGVIISTPGECTGSCLPESIVVGGKYTVQSGKCSAAEGIAYICVTASSKAGTPGSKPGGIPEKPDPKVGGTKPSDNKTGSTNPNGSNNPAGSNPNGKNAPGASDSAKNNPNNKNNGTCASPNQCMTPSNNRNNNNTTNQYCMLNGQQFQMSYCNSRQSEVQNGMVGCRIANQFIPADCNMVTYENGGNGYNNNQYCMLNGQQFQMSYCNSRQSQMMNGINGCMIAGQFIPVSCGTATFPNNNNGSNNMFGIGNNNSPCSNNGTVTQGTCPTAGQICCAQPNLMQSLAGNLGNLLNRLSNPSGTSSYPNIGALSPTPYISITPTPTLTSSGSAGLNNPNGVDVTFNMKLKLHGVVNPPKSGSDRMRVLVTIVDTAATSGLRAATTSAEFTATGSAIFSGSVTFTKVEPKSTYYLLIKGPKHVQKKICSNSPTETSPGEYVCTNLLTVTSGTNDINLSNIYLMAGDVPKQDGVVNSVDFGNVRTRFGKADYPSLEIADLNFDGVVNTQDFSLIIQTLQTTNGADQK
jgi:hypothetical protein